MELFSIRIQRTFQLVSTYLYIVKEMTIAKTITKSDEFSVMLIQWLS